MVALQAVKEVRKLWSMLASADGCQQVVRDVCVSKVSFLWQALPNDDG